MKTGMHFVNPEASEYIGGEYAEAAKKWADGYMIVDVPEQSEWQCRIGGVIFNPKKGQESNRFHRWMQRIAFGFMWERAK